MGLHFPNTKITFGAVAGIVGGVITVITAIPIDSAAANAKTWFDWLAVTFLDAHFQQPHLKLIGPLIMGVAFLVAMWGFLPKTAGAFKGYLTPPQVIKYLKSDTAWAAHMRDLERKRNKRENTNTTYSLFGEAWFEFQRQACNPNTKIRVWGLKNGQGELIPIPPSFWITNNFAFRETVSGQEHRTLPFGSKSKTPRYDSLFYSDLRIERSGVQMTWRRPINPIAAARLKKRKSDQEKALNELVSRS